ncbi:uncharacterized protein LOC107044363 isoform X2 [Diachasma alloeum]|nr:uncharacterized protein LOC107044363 isoform X2 [Diachasma alloeum]
MSETARSRAGRDEIFNKINRFITLQKEHVEQTNPLLREVLNSIMEIMKNEDPLFKDVFQEIMFAGSFYKGTRVGKPEEFDLDLILKLPVDYSKIKFEEDRPGYARIKLPSDSFKPAWETHKKVLNKWISNGDNCLNNDELRRWFESVVTKSFSRMEKNTEGWSTLRIGDRSVKVKTKKSGPAFTLMVVYGSGKFDVDLVPVLEFKTRPKLVVFRRVPTGDKSWYLVPKPLKTGTNPELSWRFCFYVYEKALLSTNGKIKTVIRQLKKLKDCQNWSSILASYYIETLVYHELIAGSLDLSRSSMSTLLLHMLKKLSEACDKHSIPYYWDTRNNLIAEKTSEQLLPIKKRMQKIIKDIEDNPEQAIDYFLKPEERQALAAAGPSPPTTPNSDDSWTDFGDSSPMLEAQLRIEEKLLINFLEPEIPEGPKNIQSMDQIAILTRTVATLTDEIKTLRSTFSGEIRDLKSTMKEQTEAMNEIIQLLVRREMREVNLMSQSLL